MHEDSLLGAVLPICEAQEKFSNSGGVEQGGRGQKRKRKRRECSVLIIHIKNGRGTDGHKFLKMESMKFHFGHKKKEFKV